LDQYRAEKDAFFKSARSPLPHSQRAAFTGLSYYPPDAAWQIEATLEPDAAREQVVMPTSTGDERVYERLGWAVFDVNGSSQRLALYVPAGDLEPESAFVPFMDATSGSETYGGGRYLDARLEGERVLLDFNLAYHPYCAYAPNFSCPIPPLENRLPVPVRAGERNPESP
jgi:uncharacterized protein (DUF1684 family)